MVWTSTRHNSIHPSNGNAWISVRHDQPRRHYLDGRGAGAHAHAVLHVRHRGRLRAQVQGRRRTRPGAHVTARRLHHVAALRLQSRGSRGLGAHRRRLVGRDAGSLHR